MHFKKFASYEPPNVKHKKCENCFMETLPERYNATAYYNALKLSEIESSLTFTTHCPTSF